MLRIHILNVGHGDSIVLDYDGPQGRSFALIDSNQVAPGDPPALSKLRALGATNISFIALTHPHADHYKGLSRVLDAYRGHIGMFVTFPLRGHVEGRIKALAKAYKKVYDNTDSPVIRGRIEEFIQILFEAKAHVGIPNWFEPTGPHSEILPQGFAGVEIHVMTPPANVKGVNFTRIEREDATLAEEKLRENSLSLAFLVRYQGKSIVLGGDATYVNITDHRRHFGRQGRRVEAQVVKLPHHGARDDCQSPVLDHLFGVQEPRFACISANGHSHPQPDTYKWLADRNIKPYCTNLAKSCGATAAARPPDPQLAPALDRLIDTLADGPPPSSVQPCQGDIQIQVTNTGEVTVTPQFANFCPYRPPIQGLRLIRGSS